MLKIELSLSYIYNHLFALTLVPIHAKQIQQMEHENPIIAKILKTKKNYPSLSSYTEL